MIDNSCMKTIKHLGSDQKIEFDIDVDVVHIVHIDVDAIQPCKEDQGRIGGKPLRGQIRQGRGYHGHLVSRL